MEWDEKLQLIVDYIEKHLQRMQEPINPQEVAEIAGCAPGCRQCGYEYGCVCLTDGGVSSQRPQPGGLEDR